MAIRMDRATRIRLRAVAKRRRLTPSALVRTALEQWLEAEDRAARTKPYDQMADLIGCISGPGNLSIGVGRRVAALLRGRRGNRDR